jgi:transposase
MVCQLHHLLLELIPGGAKKDLSAAQVKALLAKVRPRDAAGRARRRVAAELISDLERLYQRKKAASKELNELLPATGSTLTGLHGIGPSGAARLLVEAGGIARFPSKAHFASWNGTAPIDASSGDQVRHRLSRAGNRQVNRVLHIMAVVQLRHRDSEGRAYYDRKVAAGKTTREAMRALKRRLSDIACHQMILDHRSAQTGPGGHVGAATGSSAAGFNPSTGASEKSFPGPPPTTLRPRPAVRSVLRAAPATPRRLRPAAAVKRPLLDGGESRRTLKKAGTGLS